MTIRAEKLKEWCDHYTVVSGEIDRDFDEILKDCTEVGNARVCMQ